MNLQESAKLALKAKRRTIGSSQLTGDALELFLDKKPFELEDIINNGASTETLPKHQILNLQ